MPTGPRRPWLSLAIFAALFLHASTKVWDRLPEMLWACYVASALLGAGILAGAPTLAAIGFLFEATVGCPALALDIAATRSWTATSVLAHLAPLAAGFVYLRRTGLPRGILLPAWAIYPVMIAVSYWLTPPALNVNLAHAPWTPSEWAFPSLWMYWLFNAAAALALLWLSELLLRRLLGETGATAAATVAPRSPGG